MKKRNLDWSNIGCAYHQTTMRYVANDRDGAWDDGKLSGDAMITPVSYTHLDVYKRQVSESTSNTQRMM